MVATDVLDYLFKMNPFSGGGNSSGTQPGNSGGSQPGPGRGPQSGPSNIGPHGHAGSRGNNDNSGATNDTSAALEEERANKYRELSELTTILNRKRNRRIKINNDHSTAGDNSDDELEKRLGEALEDIDLEISDLKDKVREIKQ